MSRVPSEQDSTRQALDDAIDILTVDRLQTVLREICSKSPEAFKLACDKLLVKEEQLERPAVSLLDGPLAETSTFKLPTAGKRRRETPTRRYEICEQCEEEYDVLKEEICVWHPGDLEIDYEDGFWDDTDYETWGDPDTDANREDCPEGFAWSCCNARGDVKGCMETPHEPSKAKRSKV